MDGGTAVGLVALSAVLLFLIGHSFIDSFFERKEEMMNRIIEKGEE